MTFLGVLQLNKYKLFQLVYDFYCIILQTIFNWLWESFSDFLSGLYSLVARTVSRLMSGKYRKKTYKENKFMKLCF